MPAVIGVPKSQEEAVQDLLKIQKQEYDEGSKYTQLILGLGYAGFFAVWAGTRDQLTKVQVVASALLMGLSLAVYIAFEVYQMLHRARLIHRLSKALAADSVSLAEAIQDYRRHALAKSRKLVTAWYFALFLTIIPGLSAAAILFYAFFARLYHML